MKVLITGGSGFLGSHITDRLLERGDEVLVIDNYATGRRDNLVPRSNLRIVEGTIADTALVNSIFDEFKPEKVVHAAASYKDPNDWCEDTLANVLGTANVVKAAERVNVNRLIYFQTALCYGLHPIEQPITLDHPIRPEGSSYAISKTAGEHYIALSSLEFISFRLANAYGPRNISGPLPTFYHRLTNGQKCFVMNTRRDFIYVQDLVDVVIKALDGMGAKGYYHISSGSDFSIKELYDATVAAMDLNLSEPVEVRERNPDDVFSILLDPSKTNRDFEWQTSTPLLQGVKDTIDYYQKFGINQTYTHLHMPKE
ncbi:MAG: NAD-dependent epimerase/dehydratase family protein [Desulfuromonadales bacterium]|nr:MAG: NAD-dependent epimerase/dehydratase family protein [Desulfuromonadales bacterium]